MGPNAIAAIGATLVISQAYVLDEALGIVRGRLENASGHRMADAALVHPQALAPKPDKDGKIRRAERGCEPPKLGMKVLLSVLVHSGRLFSEALG